MTAASGSLERIANTRLDAAALKVLGDGSATLSDLRETLGEERFGALISLAALAARLDASEFGSLETERCQEVSRLVAKARSVNPEFFASPLVRNHAATLHRRATQEVEADADAATFAGAAALQRQRFGAVAASPVIRFGAEDQPELYVDFRLLDESLDLVFDMELSLSELLTVSFATLAATTEALNKGGRVLRPSANGWQTPHVSLREKLASIRTELDRLDRRLSTAGD